MTMTGPKLVLVTAGRTRFMGTWTTERSVTDDDGARTRAEEPIDRANGESAAHQEVLERSDVPPEPAPADQAAAEGVSAKPAEGRARAGAGAAVDE